MATLRKVPRAVVITAPALVAFALGAAVAWRSGERSPGEVAAVDEELLDPLSAAHGLVGLAHPGARQAGLTLPGARTPGALLRVVAERVTLVPYEGALASPGQVLEAGVANGVDRARLFAALLADAGHVARVVQVEASAGAAHVHATATPRPTSSPPAALQAALAARVAELAPEAWERLSSERGWVAAAGRVRGERSVTWVQVQHDGAWADLVFPDTDLAPEARRRAAPLDEAACAWTVTLRLTNVWRGAERAPQEVLAFSAPAAELHARSLSITNVPDPTLARFVPTLAVGERTVEGAAFELGTGRDLARQLLHVEVRGPASTRRSTRLLVGPRGAANDTERALEVAALARVLVVTGPVSDAHHADAVARTLAHGAALVRGEEETGWLDAPPLRALTLLRASRALAGQVGVAARACLAFQDRPAVVIERGWITTHARGLRRHDGLDLVDPGHAFAGPQAARAAVEQGLLDGLLEHVVLADRDALSSGDALAALLEAGGAALDVDRPAAAPWSDEVDGAAPRYRLSAGETGLVGFRLDPGPQVVPLLPDGTGGAVVRGADLARIDEGARAVRYASAAAAFVPAHVVPFFPLMHGLVGYFQGLAKAYLRAASVIEGLAARIAGEAEGPSDEELRQLKELLEALFPQLAGDILEGFVAQGVAAYALMPALRQVGSAVKDLLGPFVRSALRKALGAATRAGVRAGARAASGAATRGGLTYRELAARARELRRAGWTKDQVRRYFEELGCFPAGTLVLTSTGPRAIETLAPGDRVLSRDPTSGAQGYRPITAVFRRTTSQLTRVTLARVRPRQVGRTEAHHARRASGDEDGDDDGEPPSAALACTPNHPIWRAGDGFVPAALLRPGDLLRGAAGEPLVVERVVREERSVETWNLEVAGWHTYFVAGREGAPAVWVHNTCLPGVAKGTGVTRDEARRLIQDSIGRAGNPVRPKKPNWQGPLGRPGTGADGHPEVHVPGIGQDPARLASARGKPGPNSVYARRSDAVHDLQQALNSPATGAALKSMTPGQRLVIQHQPPRPRDVFVSQSGAPAVPATAARTRIIIDRLDRGYHLQTMVPLP